MMTPDENNKTFQLATEFINETSEHIFLTGKAGTGKTTFLRYIREHTHKRTLVTAPTGVAAVNAGGITLHSLFQLPFEPYIPGISSNYSQKNRFRFAKAKLDLLRQLELLIIDEVSMLRVDTLDAIDASLRSIRRNQQPFGGVQVLYIGDMFQLPPIAKNDEWDLLKDHYASTFFFHAKVIEKAMPIYLELKTVYRQSEEVFVDLLNKIRNNQQTNDDIARLNEHYIAGFTPPKDENYITLTTHNNRADQINEKELDRIISKEYTFSGEISGEFPDYSLPTDMQLRLKEGAQIMFIKNDTCEPRRYYNGKIATIKRILGDQIYVYIEDLNSEILLQKETWKNIRYSLNKESGEIEEEELGSFTQYPVRLAWAITIHKSQGLTFDRAIIDIGASFAAGQVYVALSRCRSLDGMILLSRINQGCIMTDEHAINFSHSEKSSEDLSRIFIDAKRRFWAYRLLQYFEWKTMHMILRELEKLLEDKTSDEFKGAKDLIPQFKNAVRNLENTALKFQIQLKELTIETEKTNDLSLLKERCQKAVSYFFESISAQILIPLQEYITHFKSTKKAKTFHKNIIAIEEDIILFMENMKRVRYNNVLLIDKTLPEIPRRKDIFSENAGSDKPVKEKKAKPAAAPKREKGATQKQSFDLYKQGLSIEDISKQRTLAYSTIESHLSEFIKTGDLSVYEFITEEDLNKILPVLQDFKDYENPPFKLIVSRMNGEYTYGQIRMAFSHLQLK